MSAKKKVFFLLLIKICFESFSFSVKKIFSPLLATTIFKQIKKLSAKEIKKTFIFQNKHQDYYHYQSRKRLKIFVETFSSKSNLFKNYFAFFYDYGQIILCYLYKIRLFLFIQPSKMGSKFVFNWIIVFVFTQKQTSQIIILLGWVIYHVDAFSVVIQTKFKIFKKLSQYREKQA